ncbi:MAG: hypothetical protein KC502_07915 [Myxococcales bacterium]|nr:hypothetical protein [Myxococcales bacterium]
MRVVLAGLITMGLVGLSGCTTSKAVRAFHDGEKAEKAGDYARAAKRYQWAFKRNGALVGAELNRLRILARQPDEAANVDKALKELSAEHRHNVHVHLFAVGWALAKGDVAGANKRLGLIGEVSVAKADKPFHEAWKVAAAARQQAIAKSQPIAGKGLIPVCGPAKISWLRLRVRASARGKKFAAASEAARVLLGDCKESPGPLAIDLARMHLGLQQPRKARRIAARMKSKRGPDVRALSAEIAFALNEPARVARLVRGRDDPRALALMAWVQWRQGKHHRAIARSARAIRADPKAALAVQVQVAAAMSSGELELAEGVLRGAGALLGIDVWTLAFAEGVIAVRAGKLASALRSFQRAVARCPTCKPPRHNLRVLRRATGASPSP